MENLEQLVTQLITRIEILEATVAQQQKELEILKAPSQLAPEQKAVGADKQGLSETTISLKQQNRRSFLTRLAGAGFLTFGAGLVAVSTGQKEALARILVNPTGYELQFGAITTPRGTTISGTLGDTNVRIGLAACGDPTMDYAKLPLFDAGVYAQGAGYGIYAITDRAMGTAGYFRNIASSGVGSFYAITAISNNGTAISATGAGLGIAGNSSGSSSGVYGSSNSGPGVSGFSSSGPGLSGSSSVGVPLHLDISNNVPTGGTRGKGDFYVDILGKVYVWARNDANSADIWRQVQFVPA